MENEFIKLYVKELKGKGLSLFDKAVYSSLLSKYQYRQEAFYTYESFIADELEISERTVRNSIKKLEELNLISIERRYNKETKKTVNYYIIKNLSEAQIKPVEETTTEEIVEPIKEEKEPLKMEIIKSMDIEKMQDKQPEYSNPQYMQIFNVIKNDYNSTPEEYFANINGIMDIKYTELIELSDAAETNPQVTLDFIKEIRKIA